MRTFGLPSALSAGTLLPGQNDEGCVAKTTGTDRNLGHNKLQPGSASKFYL
ncbi:hypothetical protein GA0061084_0158 [Arthrobacter sp. NIO-1057]|nr:hypothetical protein GA0061084_0158 [Arthrobacter sp. NIO-1057]